MIELIKTIVDALETMVIVVGTMVSVWIASLLLSITREEESITAIDAVERMI
ncbi:MAG: hypothetical protein LBR28_02970 [Bacteroidales bacterium]|jgi:hypothetical protein|nr:hypothetical protein [Bacteroidales bacterium]